MLPRVIAICGPQRVGKNTLASALVRSFPHVYTTEMSFAEPMKSCIATLFRFQKDQVDGDKKDVPDARWENKSPREIMQFFGTEMMQFKIQELLPHIGRRFWSAILVDKIKAHLRHDKGGVIITDMRFLHEYTDLKHAFGNDFACIRITSSNVAETKHVSEKEHLAIPVNINIMNTENTQDAFCQKAVQQVKHQFFRKDD